MRCIYEANISKDLKQKIKQLARDYGQTRELLVKFAKSPKGKKACGSYYEHSFYRGVAKHFQSHWRSHYDKFIFINTQKHNDDAELFRTFAHEFKHYLQDVNNEGYSEHEAQRFEVAMTNQLFDTNYVLKEDERRVRVVVKNGEKKIYKYRPRYFNVVNLKERKNEHR